MDYRRMGNMADYGRMGNMEVHLGNTTSTISMHLRDLWKSPRGTVLRIQALTGLVIILSFLLATFGSCRRWSNRWIVQKGFFIAHALSLSLGTYSIGLMQSSSVKSEMFPIWTVCLFTIFVSIDPVTTYNGLDYKGPLSKMVYGICLNFGYVLLMTISTISSGVGSTAIGMLSAITFIKGFHGSLALVQQMRMRNMVQKLPNNDNSAEKSVLTNKSTHRDAMMVDFPTGIDGRTDAVTLHDIDVVREKKNELRSCYDVCTAFSLSHLLQRHFLGLGYGIMPNQLYWRVEDNDEKIDCKWALKLIEIELAFLFEVFFTGNAFLRYYQAKTASLWTLASFIGICFVGVAVAIPGTITSSPGGSANILDTTTADLVTTFFILASLALLQLVQLIQCWTSNWARLAVACAYARNHRKKETMLGEDKIPNKQGEDVGGEGKQRGGGEERRGSVPPTPLSWIAHCMWERWMGLKVYVATGTNWSDKHLWQDKIRQHSLLPEGRLIGIKEGKRKIRSRRRREKGKSIVDRTIDRLYRGCVGLVKLLGLDYIWEVLLDLLGGDSNKSAAIRLDDVDVKASIIDFLEQIKLDNIDGKWFSFPKHPIINGFLPYSHEQKQRFSETHGQRYARCVIMLHIATWYCELAEQEQEKKPDGSSKSAASNLLQIVACFLKNKDAATAAEGGEREENRNHRRVANALSKYCAYLVVSAPELLPGPASDVTHAYNDFKLSKDLYLRVISDPEFWKGLSSRSTFGITPTQAGLHLAKLLVGDDRPPLDGTRSSDVWETLADVWVRMLVYAAPYGNLEAHMRHLSQGGEFITHIWALLYHIGIREWTFQQNLHTIDSISDADEILMKDKLMVVAFVDSLYGSDSDVVATTASKHIDRVTFYLTSKPDVAKRFHIDPAAKRPALIFIKREEKFTLYETPTGASGVIITTWDGSLCSLSSSTEQPFSGGKNNSAFNVPEANSEEPKGRLERGK
ncbi:uncharacterized protein LOC120684765 [Panicum virgatum]|uniref:uncharacterized protein LOC120684765 n=1 Tax=Panicum virgatum TaxID=38727 RepID=UPI0019D574E0|nr:uncharacterized protein LOC120684765 [Panicum virgatum]